MSHVAVVEKNAQQHIQKVSLTSDGPISVGRAWHNDIIISDEYIDASHLQVSIDLEGKITVRDLDTKNGTQFGKRSVTGKFAYAVGSRISIGDSTVTFYDVESEIVPAVKHDTAHVAARKYSSIGWFIVASLAACVGLVAATNWLDTAEATSEALVSNLLAFTMSALIWSLLAGFIGKLFRHNTYLKLHWIFICAISVLYVVMSLVLSILRFNLDSELSETVFQYGLNAGIIVIMAYGTLSLSTRIGRRKKLVIASVLCILPVLASLITPMLAEDHDTWTSNAIVQRVDQPPAFFFRKPVTLEVHIQNTDALFTKLDAQVADSTFVQQGNGGNKEGVVGSVQFSEIQ